MAYVPIVFTTGDIVTAAQMNAIQTQYSEASTDLTNHQTATRPHQFVDGATTYNWGLTVVGGVVTMDYEAV